MGSAVPSSAKAISQESARREQAPERGHFARIPLMRMRAGRPRSSVFFPVAPVLVARPFLFRRATIACDDSVRRFPSVAPFSLLSPNRCLRGETRFDGQREHGILSSGNGEPAAFRTLCRGLESGGAIRRASIRQRTIAFLMSATFPVMSCPSARNTSTVRAAKFSSNLNFWPISTASAGKSRKLIRPDIHN
jgi:hypothetical protein